MLNLLLLAAVTQSQVKPEAAPGAKAEAAAPFSYYLVPSDEIGFKDCPQAFQITFDGAINNGFGELDLEAGTPLRPVNQRVKTLYKGYLPIVEYGFDRDGAHYAVQAFAAPYNLDPMEDLVAFERVTVSNRGQITVHAALKAAINPRGAVGRSDLRCRKWYESKFASPPPAGTPIFMGGFSKSGKGPAAKPGGWVVKDNRLTLIYSGSPSVDETSHAVAHEFDLSPGASRTVDFQMPFVPVNVGQQSETGKIWGLSFDAMFPKVVASWEDVYKRSLQIDVDDPKVVDTMRASLTYDLMARDIEADGKHFTQTVNKFQYHAFFARDTSFIARSYELMNLPDVARGTIEKYLVRDAAGNVTHFLRTSPDDWGQSLWAVGSYFRATGDVRFAEEVLPAIAPHLDEFDKSVASDPLGLWPVAGPYDNELINGHYTSHNLWALLGLREAENLARAAGAAEVADRAHATYARFDKVFKARLAALTAKADGYIPPGMDDPLAGYDWENASGGVYPFHVLPPDDPWVEATVKMERDYKYREGIMTWGPNAWAGKTAAMTGKPYDPLYLHDYDTFQVDETLLARDEQKAVVEDLYSTLVHTSSTHGGFETSIRPWGNRDPDDNYPPHGWFAARYNELVRNMLLREVDGDLHIASALAPDWVKPGKTITVRTGRPISASSTSRSGRGPMARTSTLIPSGDRRRRT